MRIDVGLEGLPRQKAITDDILVFGSGDTDKEAFEDHDRNLRKKRCSLERKKSPRWVSLYPQRVLALIQTS